ncbi:MAG: sporulation protein YabP [Clostridiales bacterium]|nr:sporulation protein YabP [Clostridiales bacterium]
MEERQAAQNHTLILKNRKSLQLTGVMDVISFDSIEIILETASGMLMIKGSDLHMSHLTVEKGEVNVDGNVDSLTYSDSHKASKQAGKILGRLFK